MEVENAPFVPFSQQQIHCMLKDMDAPSKEVIEQYCEEIRQWLETEKAHSKKIGKIISIIT